MGCGLSQYPDCGLNLPKCLEHVPSNTRSRPRRPNWQLADVQCSTAIRNPIFVRRGPRLFAARVGRGSGGDPRRWSRRQPSGSWRAGHVSVDSPRWPGRVRGDLCPPRPGPPRDRPPSPPAADLDVVDVDVTGDCWATCSERPSAQFDADSIVDTAVMIQWSPWHGSVGTKEKGADALS